MVEVAEVTKTDAPAAVVAAPVIAPVDLVAALEASIAKAGTVTDPAAEPFAVTPGLEDAGKALEKLAEMYGDDPLRKGMRGIASLAYAIYQVVSVQNDTANEAAREGDGSTVPAKIQEGIKTLGDALIAMAQEEIAELVVDIGADVVVIEPEFEYAARALDIVKADTALIEKVGARNSKADASKVQAMHDHSVALGAMCATTKADGVSEIIAPDPDAIAKAALHDDVLTKAIGVIDDLTERLAKLEAQPAAPKAMTSAGLTVISKGDDLIGEDDAIMTKADVTAYLDKLPEAERGQVLLKMALGKPIRFDPVRR